MRKLEQETMQAIEREARKLAVQTGWMMQVWIINGFPYILREAAGSNEWFSMINPTGLKVKPPMQTDRYVGFVCPVSCTEDFNWPSNEWWAKQEKRQS
jgi:hypothetical protein